MIPDLVFHVADGIPLKLDLYLPSVGRDFPLVVWIHGGGWREGSKQKPPVRRLVEEGFALASISYRLTHQAIFPHQLYDCQRALVWLRSKSGEYGYQSAPPAVVGCSAGGTLAMLLGCTSRRALYLAPGLGACSSSLEVRCVVNYFGPSDFVLRGKTQAEIAYTERSGSFGWLGGRIHGHVDAELEQAASPALLVDQHMPPLLLFHGDCDELVLMDQAEAIEAACRLASREVHLVRVSGAGHGGGQFFWGQNYQTLRQFLMRHFNLGQ
ncbi:MAG: alpha/beta hydrolase [Planctomycetales bacterium]|nr:alpha/beta hydrolase [Planctomycetales bacterium]